VRHDAALLAIGGGLGAAGLIGLIGIIVWMISRGRATPPPLPLGGPAYHPNWGQWPGDAPRY
jgi:hypothetical protein